jgi:hypothetical protein
MHAPFARLTESGTFAIEPANSLVGWHALSLRRAWRPFPFNSTPFEDSGRATQATLLLRRLVAGELARLAGNRWDRAIRPVHAEQARRLNSRAGDSDKVNPAWRLDRKLGFVGSAVYLPHGRAAAMTALVPVGKITFNRYFLSEPGCRSAHGISSKTMAIKDLHTWKPPKTMRFRTIFSGKIWASGYHWAHAKTNALPQRVAVVASTPQKGRADV